MPHARQRIRERAIPEALVYESIANPTKVLYDAKGRVLIKKLYKNNKGQIRLLLIAVEPRDDSSEIITVIETSKIKKYL